MLDKRQRYTHASLYCSFDFIFILYIHDIRMYVKIYYFTVSKLYLLAVWHSLYGAKMIETRIDSMFHNLACSRACIITTPKHTTHPCLQCRVTLTFVGALVARRHSRECPSCSFLCGLTSFRVVEKVTDS